MYVCVFIEDWAANLVTLFTSQTENSERERDVYEELLTQAEIQGNINKVNSKYAPAYLGDIVE